MSLYSPQEREEYDRTGERPGLEDWPPAQRMRQAGRVQLRLRYLTVALVVIALLQLVNVARDLDFAFAHHTLASVGMLAAAIDLVAVALTLGLAGQLWYLRTHDKPAPVVVATAVATATARALLAIGLGLGAGRPAAVALVLPFIACCYALGLIRARARETRSATV